jgi:hypothetical protein
MVRSAIEKLYTGLCNTFEYEGVRDPVTKITKHQEVPKLINQPCKLSFEKINSSNQSETAASIAVTAKLFISPDVVISPGSKLVVTQNGKTTEYKSSGEPAFYASHQEVILELFKGWS